MRYLQTIKFSFCQKASSLSQTEHADLLEGHILLNLVFSNYLYSLKNAYLTFFFPTQKQPVPAELRSLKSIVLFFAIFNQYLQNYNRMKITAELIQQSPQFTNPLNERQLDLRGYKITAIQNMGATLNFFECIDLSDNEIRKLGNFSYLDRLTSLILTNNRIKQLSDLSETLPNIENIFLMNNKISDLQEVYKLGTCSKLQRLVLVNNIVAQTPNYRLNVIARIPSLRILDFAKVTKQERREAEKILATEESKK